MPEECMDRRCPPVCGSADDVAADLDPVSPIGGILLRR
jgi:hypothetical protein